MSAKSILGWALLLLSPLAGNDNIDDQLESAQLLAAAGKLNRALCLADALSVVHPDDPRVHYRRYRLLKSLERLNDAADSLQRAESTLAEWRRKGLKNESIAALEEPIAAESNTVLSFRRETQKL